MKLHTFGVQELHKSEIRSINGGIIEDIGYAIGYVVGTLVEPIHNAYERGYDEGCGCN